MTADGLMPRSSRHLLFVAGGSSWFAGGVATFLGHDGSATVTLIGGGITAAVLSLIGRWPQRVNVLGADVSWSAVEQTVDASIEVSARDGASPAAELQELPARLEHLRRTGEAPPHPAQIYDRAVEAALRRLLPNATVHVSQARSRTVPDFELRLDDRVLLVETKWRRHSERPLEGSTLPTLVNALPRGSRLLVVANAEDIAQGKTRLDEATGGRARIITWRDARDDDALAAALRAALQG